MDMHQNLQARKLNVAGLSGVAAKFWIPLVRRNVRRVVPSGGPRKRVRRGIAWEAR